MIEREKAKMLAQAGLQIAISQLVAFKKEEEAKPGAKEEKPKPDPAKEAKAFLMTILPVINRSQTFALNEKIDGIDGEINVVITCEQGKIDINAMFDFEKKDFAGQGFIKEAIKKGLKVLFDELQKIVGGTDLFKAFEKFLKERQYELNDVTELLAIPAFAVFKNNIFYEPISDKKQQQAKKAKVYLTDIFTVHSGEKRIEPWLLSDSVAGLFGLKQAGFAEVAERKKNIEQWLKNFKLQVPSWKQEWKNTLGLIYGKELNSLPKGIESMLSVKFEPKQFSVLCFGTVGNVTQRLLALVERTKDSQNDKISYDIKVKRLYWL